MAAEASSASPAAEKTTVVVGVDESDHSFHALQWVLRHFFSPPATAPGQPPQRYRLVVVTAIPTAIGVVSPGVVMDVRAFVEADLNRAAQRVLDKAKDICAQVAGDAEFEAVVGDARRVLCDAAERHHAEMLVVGSHGYGAIKRAVLGSVSDYCVHHAHCTVMIVKKPKHKN